MDTSICMADCRIPVDVHLHGRRSSNLRASLDGELQVRDSVVRYPLGCRLTSVVGAQGMTAGYHVPHLKSRIFTVRQHSLPCRALY